jgi:hypothetical protein
MRRNPSVLLRSVQTAANAAAYADADAVAIPPCRSGQFPTDGHRQLHRLHRRGPVAIPPCRAQVSSDECVDVRDMTPEEASQPLRAAQVSSDNGQGVRPWGVLVVVTAGFSRLCSGQLPPLLGFRRFAGKRHVVAIPPCRSGQFRQSDEEHGQRTEKGMSKSLSCTREVAPHAVAAEQHTTFGSLGEVLDLEDGRVKMPALVGSISPQSAGPQIKAVGSRSSR